jgi:choline dehydrogenase-like flavoprotein
MFIPTRLIFLLLLISFSLEAHPLTVDYVVVGVGTAGAVVAKRLSDDKKTTVVALHSGENLTQDPLIKYTANVPFTVLSALFGQISPELAPLYETGFTVPQPFADDQKLFWVIALPEGGASSINAGAYCRGTNQVYAQWEALAGPLWSIDRILNVYKKLETYQGKTPNPAFRGFHGPLHVRQNPKPSAVALKFSKAIVQATGTPLVLDYNDPTTPIGVSPNVQYTQSGDNGQFRVSSATAFLNKKIVSPEGYGIHGRQLLIHFNSMALRTIWEGNKAVGVEYLQNGIVKQVFAKKGVVVCAGLRSSVFLLQSGVGPQGLLQSLNIPVVFNNPNVGQGLADQPHIIVAFTSNPLDFPDKTTNSIFDQISWLPAPGGDPLVRQVRLSTITSIPGITVGLLDLVQPQSRGSVSISSANPLDPPVIDLGELSNPDDLTVYQAAFEVYIKGINNALQAMDPFYQLVLPDPAILNDPAAVTAFIKQQIASNEHFQSHCRMAPVGQGGVVDSTGHVYGVQNLIVADDSIVPQNMDGSPMASAYLIGANIAQILIDLDNIQGKQ